MAVVTGYAQLQVSPGMAAGSIVQSSDGSLFEVIDSCTLQQVAPGGPPWSPIAGSFAVKLNGAGHSQGGGADSGGASTCSEDGQGTITVPIQGT